MDGVFLFARHSVYVFITSNQLKRRIYGNRLAKCLIIIYTLKPEEVDLYFPAHRHFALCCKRIRGIERETQRDIIDIFH